MERMYRIILIPELEGGFTATVPSLPGCVTWGETLEEAKAMAREAIPLYHEINTQLKTTVIRVRFSKSKIVCFQAN